jgi:GDP-mannose 4,6 dehydratase
MAWSLPWLFITLGNGLGYSINEVIEIDEKVTDRKAVIEYNERRPGDPVRLVASSQKIYEELGWKAEYALEEIIASAWKWQGGNGEGNIEPPAEGVLSAGGCIAHQHQSIKVKIQSFKSIMRKCFGDESVPVTIIGTSESCL